MVTAQASGRLLFPGLDLDQSRLVQVRVDQFSKILRLNANGISPSSTGIASTYMSLDYNLGLTGLCVAYLCAEIPLPSREQEDWS